MAWPKLPVTARACCAASLASRWSSRGKQVLEIIWERLPNTLLLMIPAEIIIILFSLAIGVFSALRQYTLDRPRDHGDLFHWLLDAHLFRRPRLDVHLCRQI